MYGVLTVSGRLFQLKDVEKWRVRKMYILYCEESVSTFNIGREVVHELVTLSI